MSLETSGFMSLCSLQAQRTLLGKERQVTKLKSFWLPVRPCKIPSTFNSALSLPHSALAMLVLALCWASQPLLTLHWPFPLSGMFFYHISNGQLLLLLQVFVLLPLSQKGLLKIADSILPFPQPTFTHLFIFLSIALSLSNILYNLLFGVACLPQPSPPQGQDLYLFTSIPSKSTWHRVGPQDILSKEWLNMHCSSLAWKLVL